MMTVLEAMPRYPLSQQTVKAAGQSVPRQTRRGTITVFAKWCKGCGLCIAFCPRNVYIAAPDHRPVVAHPEACTACGWCVIHCPDFAITVEPAGCLESAVAEGEP